MEFKSFLAFLMTKSEDSRCYLSLPVPGFATQCPMVQVIRDRAPRDWGPMEWVPRWTECPVDLMPRRPSAKETECPGDWVPRIILFLLSYLLVIINLLSFKVFLFFKNLSISSNIWMKQHIRCMQDYTEWTVRASFARTTNEELPISGWTFWLDVLASFC